MISEETKRKWDFRIKYCIENQDALTEWELDFIESISNIRCFKDEELNADLSLKQAYKLSEIFYELEEGR